MGGFPHWRSAELFGASPSLSFQQGRKLGTTEERLVNSCRLLVVPGEAVLQVDQWAQPALLAAGRGHFWEHNSREELQAASLPRPSQAPAQQDNAEVNSYERCCSFSTDLG